MEGDIDDSISAMIALDQEERLQELALQVMNTA